MSERLETPPPLATAFPRVHSVKQLDGSDAAAIRGHTLHPVEPVLLRGFDPGGNSLRWTLSSLRDLVGHSTVRVSIPDHGIFSPDSWAHERALQYVTRSRMELRDYLDLLAREPDTKAYVQTQPLRALPLLAKEIDIPPAVVPSDRLVGSFLWVGPHNSATPLHFDEVNNLLCVLQGRKQVVMFRPADVVNLYPASVFERQHAIASRINLLAPDMKRFPRASRAVPYEVVVEAGDALVLPACWWHQVHNIRPTIAVNHWWRPSLGQYFNPAVFYNVARAWMMSAARFYRKNISHTYVE
jgi:cupin-like protein